MLGLHVRESNAFGFYRTDLASSSLGLYENLRQYFPVQTSHSVNKSLILILDSNFHTFSRFFISILSSNLGRESELWVIIEYCSNGNLLQFLRNRRDIYETEWKGVSKDPNVQLTMTDLVIAAYQVARGMEFLASRLVSKHCLYSLFSCPE